MHDDSIMKIILGDRLWEGEGEEVVTYFVFCFEKNLILIIVSLKNISYIDWVIIDVLIQSLLQTCRSLSSNFNVYWLNLE